jgi:cytochrome P450 family 110
MALPPGPRGPALLQSLRLILQPIDFLERCLRRHGDIFTLRFIGMGNLVYVADTEVVRGIFTGDAKVFHAGEANEVMEPVLGPKSVLLLDEDEHLHQRRLLLPPFHGERVRRYRELVGEIAAAEIARWPRGRAFPMRPRMQAITLEVILRTVFGAEGARLDALRVLVQRFAGVSSNVLWLWPPLQVDLGPLSPWGRVRRIRRELDAFLFEEFNRRRAEGTAGRDDVLSLLLAARDEDGKPMSDTELRDQMVTLLFAGYETTATSLAFAFHNVLRHPDVLERLRTEVMQGRLEFVEATAKETLRLNPVVSEVGRVLSRPMRIGGWDLPAGVAATPCIYLTHRRPDVWPEPERFDPDRFVGRRTSPYEFLPFGGGVRRCLGMAFALFEMKTVLARVLSRVELRLAAGYRMQPVRRSITLAPSRGMPVVVARRAA